MLESLDAPCILGAYSAAEEEGSGAMIGRENVPVELLSIAAHHLSLRVEEEKVYHTLIGHGLYQVVFRGDVEGLHRQPLPLQL